MTEAKKATPGKVIMLGVRASFLSLFEPNKQKNEDGTIRETWKGNFLIPKADADKVMAKFNGQKMPILKALKAASAEMKEKKWGPAEKQPKLKPEKVFLRDGDLEDWDGYAGHWYVSASADLKERPAVVTNRKDGNGEWIEAEAGGRAAPYSGCYVNATINIWVQDNEHGKRVNARLKSVQFFKDGEAFGAAPTNPNEDFEDDDVGEAGDFGDDDSGAGGDDDDSMI